MVFVSIDPANHKTLSIPVQTIPEASQLVLQAGSMGQGGEVFVLDMGEPVRIADLAKKMIHLMGLEEKTAIIPGATLKFSSPGSGRGRNCLKSC